MLLLTKTTLASFPLPLSFDKRGMASQIMTTPVLNIYNSFPTLFSATWHSSFIYYVQHLEIVCKRAFPLGWAFTRDRLKNRSLSRYGVIGCTHAFPFYCTGRYPNQQCAPTLFTATKYAPHFKLCNIKLARVVIRIP